MARSTSRDHARDLDPDELERRLTVDGEDDVAADIVDEHGGPVDADGLEQRLREDGSYEPGVFDGATGEPLTADMLEQRQVVEYDDEDRSEP